jgi:hypothetical protein
VQRAIVRTSDAWLYGLDQEYPEYDAYQRGPRRIARAVGRTVLAAGSAAVMTIRLRSVLANRWAQRSNSDKRPATPRHGPAGVVPRPGAGGRTGRTHRVELRDVDLASRHDLPTSLGLPTSRGLPTSLGSDASDPPGSVLARPPIPAEREPAASPASDGVVTNAATPDPRHTSAIPSTSAPGAA